MYIKFLKFWDNVALPTHTVKREIRQKKDFLRYPIQDNCSNLWNISRIVWKCFFHEQKVTSEKKRKSYFILFFLKILQDRGLEWFPVVWDQIKINDSIICFLLPSDTEKNIVVRKKWIILKRVSWSMEDGQMQTDLRKLCFHVPPEGHKPELFSTVEK